MMMLMYESVMVVQGYFIVLKSDFRLKNRVNGII